MSLLRTVVDWANEQIIECKECNHPAGICSNGCHECLKEIHDWHISRSPKPIRRIRYNCKKLIIEYVKTFAERYYENIKAACCNIDFSKYGDFKVLSIGCGVSPDLMAFEELANGKNILYRGMDDNELWKEFHTVIKLYTHASNIDYDFEERNVLNPSDGRPRTEIYNIIVLQYVISSILSEGGQKNQILDLFDVIVNSALLRWHSSSSTSPFLFILNDTDSVYTGRDLFYKLLDKLEKYGYSGVSYAYSSYQNGDLGQIRYSQRKGQQGYGNITYNYSPNTSNNSATLSIEVKR